MNDSQKRVARYLHEALASELALMTVLRSQIAMTPHGRYRDALDTHLRETEDHARRVKRRLDDVDPGLNPIRMGIGLVETLAGQALALYKTPLDLLRGDSGEEKVLKNAKDAAASEAMEIATYTALESAARGAGDGVTARLAASIRGDEERMLQRVLDAIPDLAGDVIAVDRGEPSYDVTETGAADAVRGGARAAGEAVEEGRNRVKRAARQTRRVPGATRVEGEVRGMAASADDLPIAGYDSLTAQEVIEQLHGLSQVQLSTVDGYERRHQDRSTIRQRIDSLRGQEPWPGYDEANAADVRKALAAADDERARAVRTYERAHKNRSGVLNAAERELTHA